MPLRTIVPASCLCLLCLLFASACSRRDSSDLLAQGMEKHRQGNYRGAVVLLKNCLERNPQQTQARFYLADAYLQEGRLDLADKEFQALAALDPDFPGLALRRAELYLRGKNTEEAARQAGRHLERQPGDPAGLRLLGSARLLQGRAEEAERYFRQAVAARPDDPEAGLALADCLARSGRREEARKLLQTMLARDERLASARFELARLETAAGNRDAALQEYRRVCELDPGNVEAFYFRGLLLLENKDADGADSLAELLLDKFPESPRGSQLKGFVFYQRGQFGEAVVRLQKTAETHPDLLTFYMLGMSYYQVGKLELAMNQFRRFLDLRPEATHPRLVLAAILLKQGRAEDAKGELQRVLRADERNALGHTLLGSAWLAQGEFDRAAAEFDTAIALNPQLLGARVSMGMFSIARGDVADGENHLVEALAIAPDTPGIRLLLAGHYLRAEKYEEAAAVLRKGMSGTPGDAILLNYLAAACFGLQQGQEAVAALEEAKRLNPEYAVPYYNLALFHLQRGDFGKAEQQYREVLERRPEDLRARLALAQTAELGGRLPEAEASYRRAARSEEPSACLELADFLQRLGRTEEALKVLAGPEKEKSPILLEGKGRILLAAGRFDEATAVFSRLEQVAAGKGFPYLLETYLARGDTEKAEQLCRQLVTRFPANPAGYLAWSSVLEKGRKGQEAIRTLQEAPEEVRNRLPVRMRLAELVEKQAGPEKALPLYQAILEEQPAFYPALFAVASAHERSGDKERAERFYRSALEARSDYAPALNNLACLYAERPDRRQDALRLALEAYRVQPGNPMILDTLGYIYWHLGRFAEARRLLERAASQLPGTPTVQYHLALACEGLGAREDAIRSLRSALRLGGFPEAAAARQLLDRIGGGKGGGV